MDALSTSLGKIVISSQAIAHIVVESARECYGVVAMAGRRWLPDRKTRGIGMRDDGDAVRVDLLVAGEYGLNLADVLSTVRNLAGYEMILLTGLPVKAVEVHIDDV